MTEPNQSYAILKRLPEGKSRVEQNQCVQVVLTFRAEQRFELLLCRYGSDWGDRSEELTRYTGTFEEAEGAITLKADFVCHSKRTYDHEALEWSLNETKSWCQKSFESQRRGPKELTCPIDAFEQGFAGKILSADAEIQPPIITNYP